MGPIADRRLAFAIALACVSCSAPTSNPIAGDWARLTDGGCAAPARIEYTRDGQFLVRNGQKRLVLGTGVSATQTSDSVAVQFLAAIGPTKGTVTTYFYRVEDGGNLVPTSWVSESSRQPTAFTKQEVEFMTITRCSD